MNKYLYLVGAVLLSLTGAIGIANADFHTKEAWNIHGSPVGFPLAYFAHELDLTDGQKMQIKAICAAERPTLTPLLRRFLSEGGEMGSTDAGASFDETKARVIADRQASIVSQLLVERQRLVSRIYKDVLTPEQRVKADHLRERMRGRVEGFLNQLEHPGA